MSPRPVVGPSLLAAPSKMVQNIFMTTVKLLPIFTDNYVFLIENQETKEVIIVDPGDSAPVIEYFESNPHLQPVGIFITHHHNDHIGGVEDLQTKYSLICFAPDKNKHHVPYANEFLKEGDQLILAGESFEVMSLPGHTLGHIAYFNKKHNWLFSGDVLFGLGCGRVFEGTMEQMFESLQKIKRLPRTTLVYCTHEYTETNYEFCRRLSDFDEAPINGENESLLIYGNELKNKRELGLPSVPLKLDIEKDTNPFLLAQSPRDFAKLRELRNQF